MITADDLNQPRADHMPTSMGMKVLELEAEANLLEMEIKPEMLNLYGVIHGGAVVALADTAAGYGTYASLPENAAGFTTIELKCNFLRGISGGTLHCAANRKHHGRSTQVWDSTVFEADSGRKIAEFRCTNMILYKD